MTSHYRYPSFARLQPALRRLGLLVTPSETHDNQLSGDTRNRCGTDIVITVISVIPTSAYVWEESLF